MSNGLKRKLRSLGAETVSMTPMEWMKLRDAAYEAARVEIKADVRGHLEAAQTEAMQRVYNNMLGRWYCMIAVSAARCGLSQRTAKRIMQKFDALCAELSDTSEEEVRGLAEQEAGILVEMPHRHKYLPAMAFEAND